MPHTKVKVLSIIFIITGVSALLAGVLVAIASLLAGEMFVTILAAENLSETMAKLLIPYTIVTELALGVTELFAGICGLRFVNGTVDEKFCRIPAVILMILFGLGLLFNVFNWSFRGIVKELFWLVMAGAYFTFVKNVEEYNRTRPAVEDMPLFNLKDE